MSETIRDGKGTGYLVGVGSSNRLDVTSRANSRIYYASRDNEKAFIVRFHGQSATGGTSEPLGYITYTGNDSLIIEQAIVCTEEIANTNTAMTKFGFWLNPTSLSGGTSVDSVNLNTSSNLTSESTCMHNNDGSNVITWTNGNSIQTVRLSGPMTYEINFNSALILGKNNTFGITLNSTTTGVKVRATILYYEE